MSEALKVICKAKIVLSASASVRETASVHVMEVFFHHEASQANLAELEHQASMT